MRYYAQYDESNKLIAIGTGSGGTEITEEEYTLYFGENYLNATTSAGAQNSAIWFVLALISGLFCLVFVILILKAAKVAKKCLANLENRCLLEKAAKQLKDKESCLVIGKKRGILTPDFIFGKGIAKHL